MNDFPDLGRESNASDTCAAMAHLDQGSLARGFLIVLAPHLYRLRHCYSWFPLLMNRRFGYVEFRRASGRSGQLALFEFKQKLLFGKVGLDAE